MHGHVTARATLGRLSLSEPEPEAQLRLALPGWHVISTQSEPAASACETEPEPRARPLSTDASASELAGPPGRGPALAADSGLPGRRERASLSVPAATEPEYPARGPGPAGPALVRGDGGQMATRQVT
eukprot:3294410-Rhodomonas_salina.1